MSQRANTYGFDEDGRYDGTEKYYWAFDGHLMDKNDMNDLPYGVDADSAQQLMSGLTHLNTILGKLGNSEHTDAALRSRLLQKLRGPMFKVVKYDVDTNGSALSYAQVCQKIRKAINVESLENGDMRISSRKRRAPDDRKSSCDEFNAHVA
jgi:hypothetical protein